MPCTPTRLPDGAAVILCSRGGPRPLRCWECGKPAAHLCDGPGAPGKTCDRPMCEKHRAPIGRDRDFCSTHVKWERERAPGLFDTTNGGNP